MNMRSYYAKHMDGNAFAELEYQDRISKEKSYREAMLDAAETEKFTEWGWETINQTLGDEVNKDESGEEKGKAICRLLLAHMVAENFAKTDSDRIRHIKSFYTTMKAELWPELQRLLTKIDEENDNG